MSVKKYIVGNKASNFTVFPNKVLQGLRNHEALGLYCYLASLPPNWSFYKSDLRNQSKIGIHKLNSLLKILELHGLIKTAQVRNAHGKFAHFQLDVDDGSNFKNNDLEESVQPCDENRNTVTVHTVNSTYKRNIEKTNKEKTNKHSCAPDGARATFEKFWDAYPLKKNRVRSERIWKNRKHDKELDAIVADIRKRLQHDVQWQNKQYIPHPATYLNNRLWEDEITAEQQAQTPKKNEPRSNVPFYKKPEDVKRTKMPTELSAKIKMLSRKTGANNLGKVNNL